MWLQLTLVSPIQQHLVTVCGAVWHQAVCVRVRVFMCSGLPCVAEDSMRQCLGHASQPLQWTLYKALVHSLWPPVLKLTLPLNTLYTDNIQLYNTTHTDASYSVVVMIYVLPHKLILILPSSSSFFNPIHCIFLSFYLSLISFVSRHIFLDLPLLFHPKLSFLVQINWKPHTV